MIVFTGKPEIRGNNDLFKQDIVEYLTKPIALKKLVEAIIKSRQGHALVT